MASPLTAVAALGFIGVLLSVPLVLAGDVPAARPAVNPLIHRAVMVRAQGEARSLGKGPIVLIGFTVWIISVVGWSIVLRAAHLEGGSGRLGPAIWMGLASVLASLMYVNALASMLTCAAHWCSAFPLKRDAMSSTWALP